METIYLLLYAAAFVFFLIATFRPGGPVEGRSGVLLARVNISFLGLGLACWVLVPLIKAVRAKNGG